MATPIHDGYSYNWAECAGNSANMNDSQQEAAPTKPQSMQLPTSAPSTSRWSRTTYSLTIYEDDGFGDDATTLREVTPVAHSADASNTAASAEEKRNFMCSRLMKVLYCAGLVAAFIAVVTIFAITFKDRGHGQPPPSSTTSYKATTSSLTNQQPSADHSPTTLSTTSQGSTVAVVQVSTQVIRTTVGTLTESAFSEAITTS